MKKLVQNLMLLTILLYASTSVNAQWLTTGNTHPLGPQADKLGTLNAYDVRIITNDVTRMTVKKNNGRVGIGTISPTNKLDVYTQTPEDGIRVIQKGTGGLGGYGGAAALHLDNGTTGGVSWGLYSEGSGNTNEGTGNFVIATSQSGSFPSINYSPFVIIEKAAGNVGIGTLIQNITNAALINKLEVGVTNPEDGIRVTQRGGANGNGAASLHLKNNTSGGKMWSIHSLGSGNTNQGSGNFLIEEADGYMVNNVDRFLIQKGTGFVGIGTSLPNDKVEINSGVADHSGLRFTQLTSNTILSAPSSDFDCHKVLSVDANGEVILIDITNPNSCTGSSKEADASQLAIQQAQIDDLKNQIAELKAIIGYNSSFSAKTATVEKAYLLQISPNPLSQKATVSYSLPADASSAQLSITDATGKVVSTYTLSNGSTEQVIDANKFPAGVYQYSLFVNGKMMDSKQMVIAK